MQLIEVIGPEALALIRRSLQLPARNKLGSVGNEQSTPDRAQSQEPPAPPNANTVEGTAIGAPRCANR